MIHAVPNTQIIHIERPVAEPSFGLCLFRLFKAQFTVIFCDVLLKICVTGRAEVDCDTDTD